MKNCFLRISLVKKFPVPRCEAPENVRIPRAGQVELGDMVLFVNLEKYVLYVFLKGGYPVRKDNKLVTKFLMSTETARKGLKTLNVRIALIFPSAFGIKTVNDTITIIKSRTFQ